MERDDYFIVGDQWCVGVMVERVAYWEECIVGPGYRGTGSGAWAEVYTVH